MKLATPKTLRPSGRPSVPLADRFWSKVNKTDRCWLWTSNLHWNGYGLIALSRNGRRKQLWARAHRIAWELTNGPIPAGQSVCHHCDTPACVRPDHLFLGTLQDNMADAVRKGRLTGWRQTGVRLNGQQAKRRTQSVDSGGQQPLSALDGAGVALDPVPYRQLLIRGEVY